MPMVRYRIRNEYGLADPELYQSADRDDPEALLEGVAMAGLVGVLRQLGDLAEFAAEIFHDLHEEVMATAARGHGLMLRVQQVEEEFPTVEKVFLSQTSHSRFSFNTGVNWHPILRMDQNLLTQGDMPRFILDSYEECHGPPRLFTLDKFDIAGAGACLKRYSDPSFFKVNLASSSLVEGDIQREKKARKIKKKGSHWRNGETLESLLAPHVDSNSQPETADQASEKIQTRRVKLKYRNLNAPDTGRSFMEKIFEVQSAKQQTLSENSINHSHTKMKSVDSCESFLEEHEIVVDPSAQSPLFSVRNPAQSSAKQEETELSTNESKKHKRVAAELSETLPDLIVKTPNTYSSLPTGKLEEMSTKAENVSGLNGYRSGEVEESPLAHQEVGQMELLTYDDGRQGGPDCSRSDDVASDLENFMDALNTMESEAETDSESRVKSDLGFINVNSQGMDSNTREGQLELQAQISETVTVENSTKLVGLDSSIKEGLSSVSDSDTLGSLAGPATPQGDMAALCLQANSEICLGERDDKTSEENLNDGEDEEIRSLAVSVGGSGRNSENLWEDGDMLRGDMTAYNLQVDSEACLSESNSKTPEELLNDNKDKQIKILEVSTSETNDRTSENLCEVGEELDLDPSDYFPCNGTSNAKASDISFRRSETGYLSSSSRVTDLASHLIHSCPQGMSDENQVINSTTNGTVSEYSTHEDTEHLYGDQRTTGTSEPPSLANDEMLIPSTDENYERYSIEYAEERISDVVTGTPDIPGHFLQTKDTNILEEASIQYLDDAALSSSMPEGEPEAPVKQDTEAISSECISPIITASVANGSSIVQSDRLAVKMENVAAPMEDLTKSESATSLENADDFVESKISVSKVLSLESEHYSEAEELEEHCNVNFTDLAPLSVQREPFPSSMLLESNASDIAVTDGPISIRDNLEPSYESMAIDHLKNEVQIGLTESDSLVTEKVTIEAKKGDEHDPCSIYSPEEEPGPHIHSQEDFVPCETVLNVQKLETDEIFGLKEIIALSSESMQNMSLSPQNDDQLLAAPTNSCSEPLVPDSDNSSDAEFLYSLPSEHALENFQLETGKESQVLSLESEQDFSSKTHLQCSPKNAQEDMSSPTHLLTKPAASFEETAETRAGNELELKSLQEAEEDYEHLVPYDLRCERVHPIGETSVLNNSLDLVHRESEPKPHEFVSNGKTSELETAPSSYLEPETAISLESTSEASVSSLASNMVMAPSSSLDFGLARSETNPPESSEPQLDEPLPSSPIQDFTETPLPPLPPLQWRMGKLRLGSQLSDGNAVQPPIGSNLFTVAPTAGKEHLHSSISLGDEWVQPEDLSTHLPALEENLQSSFVAERKMVQPLRFSELPPIVEDKEHQNGIIVSEGEMMHPIHPPSVAPPIEDGKQFYSHNELRGHMVHPSNPFAQLPALEDDMSQHLPACNLQNMQSVNLSALPQISDKERPLLGQVPPNLEANRPQHGAPSLEKDYVQPLSQYWAVSTAEYAIHQYNYGANGGENVLSSNMLVPLPTTGPMIPPHGSASFKGQNPFAPYDVIEPSTEDEKPYRKRSSILNRPRDPLIEAVASHDKSTLRKVSEMVKPPTRPKEGERDTLLDQIRNKSFNLKPAVVKRPSMKGPPTNLKVAAILEKANSIRQACVGSDEDDDGDSWSDS